MQLPNDTDLDTVSAWLQSLGLGAYAPALRANHVDEWVLARLDEADLREIGVTSVGHRKRLMAAIAQRFAAEGAAAAPAMPSAPANPSAPTPPAR